MKSDPRTQTLSPAPEFSGLFPSSPSRRPDSSVASQPIPDGLRDADGRWNIPFLMHNARILIREGEFDLADRILDSALRARQQLQLVHLTIAHRWEQAGNIERAIRHLRDALAFEASLQTIRPLSSLLVRSGRDGEAARLIERGARIGSISGIEKFRLKLAAARCHGRSGDHEAARKLLNELLEAEVPLGSVPGSRPATWDAGLALVALELQIGRFAEAREMIAELRARHPSGTPHAIDADPAIWKAEAGCHLASGDKRQAHDALARALELRINDPLGLAQLAKLAFELGIHATAARLLGEYIENCPVNVHVIYALAAIEVNLGRWNQALAHATQAVSMKPDHDGARDLVARIHVKLSKSGRTDGSGRYAIAGRTESECAARRGALDGGSTH